MHRSNLLSIAALAVSAISATSVSARDLAVVATSKPVHSLAAAVMEGAGAPRLLVDGSSSPHSFALKPSGAAAVQSADVFIRVSGVVEPFTEKLSAALPKTVLLVTLADTPGLLLLDKRTGATFEQHGPGDHGKPGHDDHDDGDDAHGAKDGHVWLNPENAKTMAARIAAVLSEKDPERAALYAANSAKLAARIDTLASEIGVLVKPVAGQPFIVFHDAYQYFEKRFGLSAVGSITVSPDVQPSAKRLSALRKKIGQLGAACVFAEPLFQPKLVAAVTEGTKARAGTLDPEGTSLEAGPELYFTLMRGMAANLVGCLKPAA